MMGISEKNKVLIDRVLDTIDWVLIHKMYKLVGRTVASESTQIPGVKKLPKGVKLSESHIREEVSSLISHAVNNDISQFVYGPWNINWVNGEWEIEVEGYGGEEGDDEANMEEDDQFIPIVESVLEVYFSPMVVISREVVLDPEEIDGESEENFSLKEKLQKAIEDEDYELASKIRDLIEIYKNKK